MSARAVGLLAAAMATMAMGLGQPAHALDWQIDVSPAGELFPALQLSQAPRTSATDAGDGDGLVSVRIYPCRSASACAGTPGRVRLRIDTPGLRTPAIVETTRDANTTLILHPRLDWDVSALRDLRVARRQRMQVSLDGETRQVEVRLHPLDDALYFVREGGDRVDLGWAFAGYVNPHDAVVDEVLALARGIDPDFSTADAADPATNLRRVGLVWAALEKHGVRYASGNPALSQGPQLYSQRVRLPAETWRERRANCIDGSVLIASVLERLGIRTFIVLVPGHAFLRFDTGPDRRDARYLETTVLGATTGQHGGAPDGAGAGTAATHFAAALAAGEAHWRRVAARLDGHHGPDYALIDIETARAYGIIPLVVGRVDGDRSSGHMTGSIRPAAAAGDGN
ncbi:MAG: hypothetical protein ABI082_01100 [Dokdonella sp.]